MIEGKLYLVATPIGNLKEFTPRAIDTLKKVSFIACEDTRTSRSLLSHFDIHTPCLAYHNFNEEESARGLLHLLAEGKDIALISDAGYPLISDPGYRVVQEAIQQGVEIIPISGANAALNALIGSGMANDHFLFYGFLSNKENEARKELLSLTHFPYTLIFYEAPHRILRTLALMQEVLGNRSAVIARELTKIHEEFIRGSLQELRQRDSYRGEIVLLIEGYQEEKKDISMSEVLTMMKEKIAKGMRVKQAAVECSLYFDISKNEIYNAYIKEEENG